MDSIFKDCIKLLSLPNISKINTKYVKNMNCLFSNCSSLINIDNNISNWHTNNATNINEIFSGCQLYSLPDISKWNTSKVIKMTKIF